MNNYLSELRIEEQLLLKLCRIDFTEEEEDQIGNLMKKVTDWEYFVRMSNENGIIALCWYNIVETGNKDLIPVNHLSTLHQGYLKSLARNTKIYSLLDEVIDLAEKAGIKVVLLKGLALERTVYGNKGLRQMNDLDLLVKREDAIRLRKILLLNGFESDPMYSPLHEKILPNYGKHLPEMYKNGLTVEIHFNLFGKNGEEITKDFVEKSLTRFPRKQNAFLPDKLYHFLFLVKHLDFHERTGISQLRLYLDLVLILRSEGNTESVKSEELYRIAKKYQLEKIVSEKISILNKFFEPDGTFDGSDLPKDDIPAAVYSKFIDFLRSPSSGDEVKPESLLNPNSEMSGFSDKLFFIIGFVFPSLTFMKFRYMTRNKITAIFHYPIRWIQILSVYFRNIFFTL